jgi:hypothetical protein
MCTGEDFNASKPNGRIGCKGDLCQRKTLTPIFHKSEANGSTVIGDESKILSECSLLIYLTLPSISYRTIAATSSGANKPTIIQLSVTLLAACFL